MPGIPDDIAHYYDDPSISTAGWEPFPNAPFTQPPKQVFENQHWRADNPAIGDERSYTPLSAAGNLLMAAGAIGGAKARPFMAAIRVRDRQGNLHTFTGDEHGQAYNNAVDALGQDVIDADPSSGQHYTDTINAAKAAGKSEGEAWNDAWLDNPYEGFVSKDGKHYFTRRQGAQAFDRSKRIDIMPNGEDVSPALTGEELQEIKAANPRLFKADGGPSIARAYDDPAISTAGFQPWPNAPFSQPPAQVFENQHWRADNPDTAGIDPGNPWSMMMAMAGLGSAAKARGKGSLVNRLEEVKPPKRYDVLPMDVDIKKPLGVRPNSGEWEAHWTPQDRDTFLGQHANEVNGTWLRPDIFKIDSSSLDNYGTAGQGVGMAMYQKLIDEAFKAGAKQVYSDYQLSPFSQRIYPALARRGYRVTKHPDAHRSSTYSGMYAADRGFPGGGHWMMSPGDDRDFPGIYRIEPPLPLDDPRTKKRGGSVYLGDRITDEQVRENARQYREKYPSWTYGDVGAPDREHPQLAGPGHDNRYDLPMGHYAVDPSINAEDAARAVHKDPGFALPPPTYRFPPPSPNYRLPPSEGTEAPSHPSLLDNLRNNFRRAFPGDATDAIHALHDLK